MEALTMVKVIWRDLRKVLSKVETSYGMASTNFIVGQYLWDTIKSHWVMDEFIQEQLWNHSKLLPHITLYLFENHVTRSEIQTTGHNIEAQKKLATHM